MKAAAVLMTTYSVPLLGAGAGSRDFVGVVTADITLELAGVLDRIRLGTTGYAACSAASRL
jgi:hypothetical protein